MRSEEDIVSTCLLYVENPASTRLPSTDPKKLFQLSEKTGEHDSPTQCCAAMYIFNSGIIFLRCIHVFSKLSIENKSYNVQQRRHPPNHLFSIVLSFVVASVPATVPPAMKEYLNVICIRLAIMIPKFLQFDIISI